MKNFGKHALNATFIYAMDKTKSKGRNTGRAFMDIIGQVHYTYNNQVYLLYEVL